ncbi:MAG: NFACT family protein [Treponema sp.]|nr:NFACT family protein [Treponema sp.]
MSLNCNEINLILSELNLAGSFIQDIIQPGYDTIALYTYKEGAAKTILICAGHDATRINETKRRIPKNEKPLRFMEFLKSKIRGAKILSCGQIGLERVIKFELGHGDERFNMFVRLWSGAANIILCDQENNILDTMFRRPQKGEVTGGIFDEAAVWENARQKQDAGARFPVRDFADVEEEILQKHPDWAPLSFNQKVDWFYSERSSNLSRAALLEKAKAWYESRRSKQEAALERLKSKKADFENSGQKKHWGDLILSNAHLIKGGSNFLECQDYQSGAIVQIKIDPKKTAQANAAHYYDLYKKEISGAEELKTEIELSQKKIAALDKAYQEILNEKNPVRIEQLLRKDSAPKQKQKKTRPGLDYTVNGWYIYVGRDANENDELLRRHVKGSDLWLHTRDCPGGYVFIKYRAGKTVPLDILLDAGNLAVYFSKARKNGKADLYYTQVKHLRRAKNGPKGLVLPTQEKNLSVTLDPARLKRLEMERQGESEL